MTDIIFGLFLIIFFTFPFFSTWLYKKVSPLQNINSKYYSTYRKWVPLSLLPPVALIIAVLLNQNLLLPPKHIFTSVAALVCLCCCTIMLDYLKHLAKVTPAYKVLTSLFTIFTYLIICLTTITFLSYTGRAQAPETSVSTEE
jgi:hypothetical protein